VPRVQSILPCGAWRRPDGRAAASAKPKPHLQARQCRDPVEHVPLLSVPPAGQRGVRRGSSPSMYSTSGPSSA
jgi:hypothetical protein